MPPKTFLPTLLSVNAGYVDTAGFLALNGLFTAHVTGNFVTIGAALVNGSSGLVAKLLALPVFCVVILLVRLLRHRLASDEPSILHRLLLLKLLLLALGAGLAIALGPFGQGDGYAATFTGLTLVAAMAIQNALHRVHLGSAPPSTLMTGTTTQIMLDLADRLHGVDAEQKAVIDGRLARMITAVLAFAGGCAAAALLYVGIGMWCFAVPVVLALGAYLYRERP